MTNIFVHVCICERVGKLHCGCCHKNDRKIYHQTSFTVQGLHQMHMIIRLIFFFLLFLFLRENTRRTLANSCAVLSTSRFDLLHGTFAVFLCQTPLIRTVLKRAPPSLLPVCRRIWRNQTRPEKDWLNTLRRPAADHHERGLWSEARCERLTPSGGLIRWLSGILNWADWVIGETLGPPRDTTRTLFGNELQ